MHDVPAPVAGWSYDPSSPVPKSTQWARANKGRVAAKDKMVGQTLEGKLRSLVINSRNRIKRGSAKLQKLDHDVDTAYLRKLWDEQAGRCAISGHPMLIRTSRSNPDFPYVVSIDRIDSDKGYVKGNVQLVCAGVNAMKSTMTMEQFIAFCRGVVENSNG